MLQEMVLSTDLNSGEWKQYLHKWLDPYYSVNTRAFSGDNSMETMNYFDYLINLRDTLNDQCGSDRYCLAYKRAVGKNIFIKEIEYITLMERVYTEKIDEEV